MPRADDPLSRAVRTQVELAVVESDVVLFLVDVEQGVHPLDLEIAAYLRRAGAGRPVILVANKADQLPADTRHLVFYELGLGDPFPVSAAVGKSSGDLLDRVVEALPVVPPVISSPADPLSVPERGNLPHPSFPLSRRERG